jgi:hypothetical protein
MLSQTGARASRRRTNLSRRETAKAQKRLTTSSLPSQPQLAAISVEEIISDTQVSFDVQTML